MVVTGMRCDMWRGHLARRAPSGEAAICLGYGARENEFYCGLVRPRPKGGAMSYVDFPVFDADMHYYEADDAFIRHVPKDMQKRCMQWALVNGKKRLLVAGQVNRFIPNPTWDPIARPGSLGAYFRGRNKDGLDVKTMFGALDPLSEHPEYQDRDARLRVMDDQGVEAAFFFPTLAVGMQQSLAHDLEALTTAFHAFNQWLFEDWGFAHQNRIFAAPVITLAEVDKAVAEVDWCIDKGARMVCMVPGPVPTETGNISPGWSTFDPFWARVNEAGITVGIHGGDAGMQSYVANWEPTGKFEAFRSTPFRMIATHEKTIFDTVAALICHGLFDRHPNVRIASIENGGMWVTHLVKELQITYGKMPNEFARNPVDTLREHVWVSPFYEDDIALIRDLLGADHVLFGSDWPHAEGLADPTAYIKDIPDFSETDIHKVMHDNAWSLATPRAA
jgi:predicted TIM-barrel fold metal-dependent hydrolase